MKNLELNNINVKYAKEDQRPAIACVDVDGLDITGFKTDIFKGTNSAMFQKLKI